MIQKLGGGIGCLLGILPVAYSRDIAGLLVEEDLNNGVAITLAVTGFFVLDFSLNSVSKWKSSIFPSVMFKKTPQKSGR